MLSHSFGATLTLFNFLNFMLTKLVVPAGAVYIHLLNDEGQQSSVMIVGLVSVQGSTSQMLGYCLAPILGYLFGGKFTYD